MTQRYSLCIPKKPCDVRCINPTPISPIQYACQTCTTMWEYNNQSWSRMWDRTNSKSMVHISQSEARPVEFLMKEMWTCGWTWVKGNSNAISQFEQYNHTNLHITRPNNTSINRQDITRPRQYKNKSHKNSLDITRLPQYNYNSLVTTTI